MLHVEFDPAKDVINTAKHGMSLARAADMAILAVIKDNRFAGEQRFRLYGVIDGKPHCLAAVLRNGLVRAISLRRVHGKEYRRHVE